MSNQLLALLCTIIAGYFGLLLGSALNCDGYLGVIFAIAVMGAFLLHAIETKK